MTMTPDATLAELATDTLHVHLESGILPVLCGEHDWIVVFVE